MAGTSKKRRAAHSPSRSSSTKKARQASTTASLLSHQDSSGPQLSRAKSVFRGQRDPYFPHNKQGGTALPTGEDYLFRIQVISKTSDLHTDVFKKAVQGLVKICFPQNVLEEIGIEVVTQHMRSEAAPEENITMMQDIFRSEMVHRVTWMLAEYLDRPAKVEAGVKAIMAASASLHGARIGDDVLGDVLSSLAALREEISDESTEKMANNTDMETLSFRGARSDTTDSDAERPMLSGGAEQNSHVVDSVEGSPKIDLEPVAHAKTQKEKEASLESKKPAKQTREGKEGKISTSWRWNIDDVAGIADPSVHFKRTSDLFAYHALPIVKQRLGAEATRKELRQEIEAMLMNMPDDEFEKWAESFSKLGTGDHSMLDRIIPDTASATSRFLSAAPAPIDARIPATKLSQKSNRSSHQLATTANATETLVARHAMIKQDIKVQDGMVTHASAAQHLRSQSTPAAHGMSDPSKANHASVIDSETPVIDLLWGASPFDVPYEMVVQTIMKNLDKRIPLESFGMPRSDGEIVVKSKSHLKSDLFAFKRSGRFASSPYTVRLKMESKLIPWVVASLSAFPELNALPSVFLGILPDQTHVLDLICDVSMPFHSKDARTIRDLFLENLRRRGIVNGQAGIGRRAVTNGFLPILADPSSTDLRKRQKVEGVLRRIAFSYKSEFNDLKNTTLVQTWEKSTGLTW